MTVQTVHKPQNEATDAVEAKAMRVTKSLKQGWTRRCNWRHATYTCINTHQHTHINTHTHTHTSARTSTPLRRPGAVQYSGRPHAGSQGTRCQMSPGRFGPLRRRASRRLSSRRWPEVKPRGIISSATVLVGLPAFRPGAPKARQWGPRVHRGCLALVAGSQEPGGLSQRWPHLRSGLRHGSGPAPSSSPCHDGDILQGRSRCRGR